MTIIKKLTLDFLLADAEVLMDNATELYDKDEEAALVCFNLAHELLDQAHEIVNREKMHTSRVKVHKIKNGGK